MIDQERQRLRVFVERIERLDEEAKALNDDRKAVYDEAGEAHLNKQALKAVVAARRSRRKKPGEYAEFQHDFDAYMHALDGLQSNPASRAPAREGNNDLRQEAISAGDDGSPSTPSEPDSAPSASPAEQADDVTDTEGSQAVTEQNPETHESPSNRDLSTGGEACAGGSVPQDASPSRRSRTVGLSRSAKSEAGLAGHEGRCRGAGAPSGASVSTDDEWPEIPAFLDRRKRARPLGVEP